MKYLTTSAVRVVELLSLAVLPRSSIDETMSRKPLLLEESMFKQVILEKQMDDVLCNQHQKQVANPIPID
jgi:hypothetical protein